MLMTIAELMSELKLSRSTIYRIIKCGGFPPPHKIGKSSRWLKKEVQAYFEDQA